MSEIDGLQADAGGNEGSTPSAAPSAGRWPAALVLVASFAHFARRAAPGVTWEDGGELATAVATGGVPHPPGFPLYALLGRAWIEILVPFVDDPARALALFSAACAAGTAALLTTLAARIGAGPGAAIAAGMLPCLATTLAAQAVTIEVYALAALLGAATLLVAATSPRPTARGAFLLGLGAGAHPTVLFLAPALAVAAARARRARTESRPLAGWSARALLWFGAGLLSFLYVPVAAARASGWSWGDPRTPGAALAHVLRRPLDAAPGREVGTQLAFLAEQAVGQWPLVVALAAVGFAVGRRHVRRGALLVLLAGALGAAAGLFWAVDYRLDLEQNRARLAGTYVPLVVAVAGLCGVALAALDARLPPRVPPVVRGVGWSALVLGLALVSGPRTLASEVDLRGDDSAERYAREVLEDCPEGAVLVVSRLGFDDVLHFPLLYAQEVLGLRPDVLVVNRALLPQAWYRVVLARRAPAFGPALDELGTLLAARPDLAADAAGRRRASVPLLQSVFDGARPVVGLARPGELLLGGRELVPGPVLWRMLPLGAAAPALSDAPPAFVWLGAARRSPWTAELASLCRVRDLERARALRARGDGEAAGLLLSRWSEGP